MTCWERHTKYWKEKSAISLIPHCRRSAHLLFISSSRDISASMSSPEAYHQHTDYFFITCHCRYKYGCRRRSLSQRHPKSFLVPHIPKFWYNLHLHPILKSLSYTIYTNNDTYIRFLAALAAPLDTLGCLVSYYWTWNRE
jgi:hypothetical protein